ncbi:MAG: DUF268 domain-containing protein [Phycisphaeraceae bacterium]
MTAPLKTVVKKLPGSTQMIRAKDQLADRLRVRQQFLDFAEMAEGKDDRFALDWEQRWLCLNDNRATTSFDRHYLYHMAWASRKLAERRPSEHHDFSSHLHFATMVCGFVPTTLYEFRPPTIELEGLTCASADLTRLSMPDASLRSVSTMHVVEHLGLGRYGDPIDPRADLAAMRELQRVLAPGGDLYFVVPVGKPRLAFNSCRVYSYKQVRDAFASLDLVEFALVEDDHTRLPLVRHADPSRVAEQDYACGCFHFAKPAETTSDHTGDAR